MRTMMWMTWLTLAACGPKAADPEPAAATKAMQPVEVPAFPSADSDWVWQDFEAARVALLARSQARVPLPDVGSPVFARLTDLERVAWLMAEMPMADAVTFQETAGGIMKVYVSGLPQGTTSGREVGPVLAMFLRVFVDGATRMEHELDLTPEALAEQPARREGLLQMRYGLRQVITGVVQITEEAPQLLTPAQLVEPLGAVWADVVPFLLPEEAAELGERMAGDPAWGPLAEGFAGAGTDPLVTDYLADHQAYVEAQEARMAAAAASARSPVMIAPEGNGVRYAHPDVAFSAVFAGAPSAASTPVQHGAGPTLTTHTLESQGPTGVTYTVACFATDGEVEGLSFDTWSTALLEQMSITQAVEVPGEDGAIAKEAWVDSDGSRALIRLAPREPLGCMVAAEYVAAEESATHKALAEAFVASFRLSR